MSLFEKKYLLPYDQAVIILKRLEKELSVLPNVIECNSDENTTITIVVCFFISFSHYILITHYQRETLMDNILIFYIYLKHSDFHLKQIFI